MVGRQRQEHRILEQRQPAEVGAERLAGLLELEQQRDVELAGRQARGDFLGLARGQRELDLGVLGAEYRARERHQRRAGRRERRHPQLPASQPGDRGHLGLGRVQPGDDPLGVLQQHLAGRREPHPSRQPLEQRDPGLGLQRRDLLRDGRLGVGESVGGRRERTAVGNLDQDAKSVDV